VAAVVVLQRQVITHTQVAVAVLVDLEHQQVLQLVLRLPSQSAQAVQEIQSATIPFFLLLLQTAAVLVRLLH
jgi:hypothetical protein